VVGRQFIEYLDDRAIAWLRCISAIACRSIYDMEAMLRALDLYDSALLKIIAITQR
jgi:hypothetical protein